jgi:hypothetical protein
MLLFFPNMAKKYLHDKGRYFYAYICWNSLKKVLASYRQCISTEYLVIYLLGHECFRTATCIPHILCGLCYKTIPVHNNCQSKSLRRRHLITTEYKVKELEMIPKNT